MAVPCHVLCIHREADILGQLARDRYDAIIYNPAAWGLHQSTCRLCDNSTAAGGVPALTRQRHKEYTHMYAGREGGTSNGTLEYAIRRARCPVVLVFPRDCQLEEKNSSCVKAVDNQRNAEGSSMGLISGFSGVSCYKLAITAVADMLQEAAT